MRVCAMVNEPDWLSRRTPGVMTAETKEKTSMEGPWTDALAEAPATKSETAMP